MAKVVSELPKRKGGGGGRAEKYPYDEWLDGQPWELTEGEDFEVSKASFMTSMRGAAKKRDLKLRSRVGEKSVVVQAFKPEAEKSNGKKS